MLKNLDKDFFYKYKDDNKKRANVLLLANQLPMISLAIILPSLLPMFFIQHALVNQEIWSYISYAFKLIVGLVVLIDIMLIATKIRYKRPDIVYRVFSLYMILINITILLVLGVFIEEKIGDYSIYYYLLVGVIPIIYIVSLFSARKKILNGALRAEGEGFFPKYQNSFVNKNLKNLILVTMIIIVISLVLQRALYVIAGVTFLIVYFLRFLVVEMYFKGYYFRRFSEQLSDDQIKKLEKKDREVNNLEINKKTQKNNKKNKSPNFVLYVIKPLQYILLYSINIILLGVNSAFEKDLIAYSISIAVLLVIMFIIINWIAKYQVGRGGKRLVYGCGILTTVIILLNLFGNYVELLNNQLKYVIPIGVIVVVCIFWYFLAPIERIQKKTRNS